MVPWKSEDKLIDLHIYIEFLRIYVYFMNYCHFYHTHTKNVSIQTLEKKKLHGQKMTDDWDPRRLKVSSMVC